MDFPVIIYRDEDDVFIGEIPILKGVHSFGKDLDELQKNLTEAVELYFEVEREINFPKNFMFQTMNFPQKNAKIKNCARRKTFKMAS